MLRSSWVPSIVSLVLVSVATGACGAAGSAKHDDLADDADTTEGEASSTGGLADTDADGVGSNGSGNEESGDEGSADEGSGDEESADEESADEDAADEDAADEDAADEDDTSTTGTVASDGSGGTSGEGQASTSQGSVGEGGAPAYSYDCGAFSEDPGWTVRDGYHAVIVANQDDGMNQPVAATFAEGEFGGLLYVVNQGDNVLRSVDVATGKVDVVVGSGAWGDTPRLLTTVTWDEHGVFDGNLYIGDQGSNADNNSRVYRVLPDGSVSTFVEGGYGLDDVYGLSFPPPASDYEPGLYVTGDTDTATRPDWGRIDRDGAIVAFSEVSGAEGTAFDPTGQFGYQLWASRPNGGGYAGDDSITPIDKDGVAGPPIASALRGIHAVTFSTGGDLGVNMYAASWSTGQLLRIDPKGEVSELATGLRLTNYDGNILAVSSDGNVMFVADRLNHQLVCIEAI